MADEPDVHGEPEATEPTPQTDEAEKQSRMWGMLCHLTALAGYVGIPLGNLIGPLVVWLLKRNEIPFVEEQGKEALNFQISMTIYGAVSAILILVVIGIPLLVALIVFDLVMIIVAAVKANNGQHFRYPITIRFLK